MDQNKDCTVNYAGVCLHNLELTKEIDKREILCAEMSKVINDKDSVLKIYETAIKYYRDILSETRHSYMLSTSKHIQITKDLIDEKTELEKEKISLKFKLGKAERKKDMYFFYTCFTFILFIIYVNIKM